MKLMIAILDTATKLCLNLSALCLSLLLMAYVFEVVARYFFNAPTTWSYDFSTWCLAVIIMAALPDVTRRNANVSIGFLLEKLPLQSRKKISQILYVFACFFCLAAAGICFQESLRQFSQQIQTNWIIPIPKEWISIIIPIGFSLCGLQFLRAAVPVGEAGS